MTQVQVVVVCAAVMLAIAALAWAVGRFAGRPLQGAPRPGTMGAIGALVVTLIAWWVLQLALDPFVAYGWPPVHAVQNLIWFMAGLQLAELVGRAVEHRGRQHSSGTVTAEKA